MQRACQFLFLSVLGLGERSVGQGSRLAWRGLAVLLLGLLGAGVAQASAFTYQVSYQGIFSAGAQVRIADLGLSYRRPSAGADYRESEMVVSSERYGHVEALYPIRYRLRSWYAGDYSKGLAAEVFELKPNKGAKHRLVMLNDPQAPFVTHDVLKEGRQKLDRLLAGSFPYLPAQANPPRFDRLGLLAHLRAQRLHPGDEYRLQVSDGKKLFEYRVSVEAREQVRAAEQAWPSLKLRFDALQEDKRGRQEHAHRPVFVWLSDDPQHIPLRAESRHTLGHFMIELNAIGQAPKLAMK